MASPTDGTVAVDHLVGGVRWCKVRLRTMEANTPLFMS